jgi:hypothetical protein
LTTGEQGLALLQQRKKARAMQHGARPARSGDSDSASVEDIDAPHVPITELQSRALQYLDFLPHQPKKVRMNMWLACAVQLFQSSK